MLCTCRERDTLGTLQPRASNFIFQPSCLGKGTFCLGSGKGLQTAAVLAGPPAVAALCTHLGSGQSGKSAEDHRIIESLRLEKISKVIGSNH